jgi:hypothetical protein
VPAQFPVSRPSPVSEHMALSIRDPSRIAEGQQTSAKHLPFPAKIRYK